MYVPADHHAEVRFHVECVECGPAPVGVFMTQYDADAEASEHNTRHRVVHSCYYVEHAHGWVGQDDCLACQREANIAASRRPA